MGSAGGAPLRLRDEDVLDVGYVSDFYELLRAIDEVFLADAVLCFEGTSVPEVSGFLRAREASDRPAVELHTIWPKPEIFHLPLTGSNLRELRAIAENYAEPEIADHLTVT